MDTQHGHERQVKTRRVVGGRHTAPDTAGAASKPSVSVSDDPHVLIAKRAYELHVERGRRDGYALDDWLEAEHEILSQILPV
jgi:hypothetical protein